MLFVCVRRGDGGFPTNLASLIQLIKKLGFLRLPLLRIALSSFPLFLALSDDFIDSLLNSFRDVVRFVLVGGFPGTRLHGLSWLLLGGIVYDFHLDLRLILWV